MNSFEQLLEFVSRLQDSKIRYRLDCVRDAIMVIVPTPSKYYEIEFFADGSIESQEFGPSSPVTETTLNEITDLVMRDAIGKEALSD